MGESRNNWEESQYLVPLQITKSRSEGHNGFFSSEEIWSSSGWVFNPSLTFSAGDLLFCAVFLRHEVIYIYLLILFIIDLQKKSYIKH